ncbi:MAG: thermonuclease family protein [Nitrospinae bacterium]|nr:thermonuclease family protein [Nitrospinota bacterium]
METNTKCFLAVMVFFAVLVTVGYQHVAYAPVQLVKVVNGADVKVINSRLGRMQTIRLFMIEPPREGDALAEKATHELEQMLKGRYLEFRVVRGYAGRPAGYLYADGENINLAVIEQGAGYVVSHAYDSEMDAAQERASAAKKGVWAHVVLPEPRRI